jgi:dTDP-4-amino-4,6-dideoxygalactose transaminase
MAGGISPGDEVITAPITDIGTVLPILWQGGVPIFADLDPRTYNLDPAAVEAFITPRTRAILAVHLAGNACDMTALRAIADRHRLFLIEDCAQAHGTLYDGKPVGTVGDVGCYSYNEFKHISCGDGGVAITNDAALAAKMRLASDKGYNRSAQGPDRNTTFLAGNYRMTELQAAVAVAQLRKLDSIISRRRAWVGRLNEKLAGVPGLLLPKVTERATSSWWFYLLRVDPNLIHGGVDAFAAAVAKEGVPLQTHYIGRPLYAYPLFLNHSAYDHGAHPFSACDYSKVTCPQAEAILNTCAQLAISEAYDDQDLEETALALRRGAESCL